MTEAKFVKQNREQWEIYSLMAAESGAYSPSELGEAYLRICTDLAFAQSHYPDTQVCSYLNSLALDLHHVLYRRQPQRWKELWRFFSRDVPLSFYESRKFMVFALLLFILGVVIGLLSQHLDTEYFERFFGYGYYAVSMENIEKGRPMDIYNDPDMWNMYWSIAINNVLVGLRYFISGLLTPFYVIYSTVMTGVMDGCFIMFFQQHGYGVDALIAPNEHGALELPAAIISSAAGLQLGFGWFFPGTRTRFGALRVTAQRSVVMALAMIPVFAVAAVIESFVTRYQEWPMILRVGICLAGLLFITYYCVVLPRMIARKERKSI